jgi:hypothetical protein
MTGSEFEGLDEMADGFFISKGTDHTVKRRWLPEAGTAEGKVRLGQGKPASPAGVVQIGQRLSAAPAQIEVLLALVAAKQACGRKRQLLYNP